LNVLVLGANGMLGSTVFRVLNESHNLVVFGTVRDESAKFFFNKNIGSQLLAGIRLDQKNSLEKAFTFAQPDIVINCIGIIKQLDNLIDPLQVIEINAVFPHQLAKFCELSKARLIHISTDCIFDGVKGSYKESDSFNAKELYGISKYLGEVYYKHSITLRTSIIGHELQSKRSLVEWFLSQEIECKGYSRAIFSGLPTVILAQIIRDVIIPHSELSGVYHVGAKPINKYDLLKLIAEVYAKPIQIISDDSLVINRSLNTDKFKTATDYFIPEWPQLIQKMYDYR
jgi:dTDP-4-dehydrorhamnose reductase